MVASKPCETCGADNKSVNHWGSNVDSPAVPVPYTGSRPSSLLCVGNANIFCCVKFCSWDTFGITLREPAMTRGTSSVEEEPEALSESSSSLGRLFVDGGSDSNVRSPAKASPDNMSLREKLSVYPKIWKRQESRIYQQRPEDDRLFTHISICVKEWTRVITYRVSQTLRYCMHFWRPSMSLLESTDNPDRFPLHILRRRTIPDRKAAFW